MEWNIIRNKLHIKEALIPSRELTTLLNTSAILLAMIAKGNMKICIVKCASTIDKISEKVALMEDTHILHKGRHAGVNRMLRPLEKRMSGHEYNRYK